MFTKDYNVQKVFWYIAELQLKYWNIWNLCDISLATITIHTHISPYQRLRRSALRNMCFVWASGCTFESFQPIKSVFCLSIMLWRHNQNQYGRRQCLKCDKIWRVFKFECFWLFEMASPWSSRMSISRTIEGSPFTPRQKLSYSSFLGDSVSSSSTRLGINIDLF